MDRLRGVILNQEGEAAVELEFGKEGGVAIVEGKVQADLVLECQCCLEPFSWPVRSEVRLGIVSSIDEADRLAEGLEPLLAEPDERVAVVDIVQDELLLAIPQVPRHSHCEPPDAENADALTDSPDNPFAALMQLKKPN